ncbi:diphthine synthase [Candidatus Woesearchaeota archaeon]|nr:MAG: diphthine synthase [Candidatus Woesearchaeota archaeon ex4484_78]RLE46555.1 MAG: diphthine synthase [Candidatus Woesearchaeota archaeon]
MLYLVGLGIGGCKAITLQGLGAVKQCDKVYLEVYTSFFDSVSELENLVGKKIFVVGRDFVESGDVILSEAKDNNVAFLVVGDPLCATTHWDLLRRAKENNIPVEVVHNASIVSSVGSTGLQVYKFGKITSIPFSDSEVIVETPYNVLKENLSIGAHTLFLLDLRPDENRFMSVHDAVEHLLKIEKLKKENLFNEDTFCIGCARIGFSDEFIKAGKARELLNVDFGRPVHCLIVPGKLHFMEEEALRLFQ